VALLLIARFGVKMVVPGFQGFKFGDDGRIGLPPGVPGVVALLQPGAKVGALGRPRADGRRDVRDVPPQPRSMKAIWLLAYGIPILFVVFVIWAGGEPRVVGWK
jgi:hypothetical protein